MNNVVVPLEEYEREHGQASSSPPPETEARRLRLVPFDEIKMGTQRRYLVKGLIPRVGLAVVWGPPKCGKSFWTFDLVLHVALGWEYRGRRVQQGPVVYCAFEGQEGFEARIEAFRQRFLTQQRGPVPFFLEPVRLDLVGDHKELIAAIRQQHTKPVAVVLDTLNRSIRGSESNDQDMTAYVSAADAIRDAFGCAVIIVHHCGIEGSRPRGHTSLTGAADAQLSVKRDAAENIVVTLECAKDGPEGDTIVSKLESVDVGTDEDGDTITSCVIVETEATMATASKQKMTDKQQNAMTALHHVAAERGKAPPSDFGLPNGIAAVNLDDWREELFRRGDLKKDSPNPRTDFNRLCSQLKARSLIAERDGLVWSARAA